MTLTRYWHVDGFSPCRLGVAYAMTHFALPAYTLSGFYLQEVDAAADIKAWNMAPPSFPLPERELAVYAGPYFALLHPGQLLTIIHEHIDAWQARREQLLMALRLTEGHTQVRVHLLTRRLLWIRWCILERLAGCPKPSAPGP